MKTVNFCLAIVLFFVSFSDSRLSHKSPTPVLKDLLSSITEVDSISYHNIVLHKNTNKNPVSNEDVPKPSESKTHSETRNTTIEILPVEDVYVRGSPYAGDTFHTMQHLNINEGSKARDRRHGYMKFDLSSVSGTITSATIKLHAYEVGSGTINHEMHLYTDDSWTEDGLTWNSRVAVSDLIGNWAPSTSSPSLIDVTSWAQDAAATDNLFSVRIKAIEWDIEVRYGTKDTSDVSIRPVLELVTSGGNQAPTVTLDQPTEGQDFTEGSAITLTATASDPESDPIQQVEFFEGSNSLGTDDTAPYETTWTPPATGSYVLSAKATDDQSNEGTSADVNITVSALNQPPAVTLDQPTEGQDFIEGNAITLTATATDPESDPIQHVEFFEGANSLGTVNSSPYELTWTPPATGSYVLSAKALDDQSNEGSSANVSITVSVAPQSGIISLAPTYDTYVRGGTHSSTNYNLDPELHVF